MKSRICINIKPCPDYNVNFPIRWTVVIRDKIIIWHINYNFYIKTNMGNTLEVDVAISIKWTFYCFICYAYQKVHTNILVSNLFFQGRIIHISSIWFCVDTFFFFGLFLIINYKITHHAPFLFEHMSLWFLQSMLMPAIFPFVLPFLVVL